MTLISGHYIQYKDWGITDTPGDYSTLARVFAFCGLDMVLCWVFGGVLRWIFALRQRWLLFVGVFEQTRRLLEKFLKEVVAVGGEAADDLKRFGVFVVDLVEMAVVEREDLCAGVAEQNGSG
jgi:hypothetical protein